MYMHSLYFLSILVVVVLSDPPKCEPILWTQKKDLCKKQVDFAVSCGICKPPPALIESDINTHCRSRYGIFDVPSTAVMSATREDIKPTVCGGFDGFLCHYRIDCSKVDDDADYFVWSTEGPRHANIQDCPKFKIKSSTDERFSGYSELICKFNDYEITTTFRHSAVNSANNELIPTSTTRREDVYFKKCDLKHVIVYFTVADTTIAAARKFIYGRFPKEKLNRDILNHKTVFNCIKIIKVTAATKEALIEAIEHEERKSKHKFEGNRLAIIPASQFPANVRFHSDLFKYHKNNMEIFYSSSISTADWVKLWKPEELGALVSGNDYTNMKLVTPEYFKKKVELCAPNWTKESEKDAVDLAAESYKQIQFDGGIRQDIKKHKLGLSHYEKGAAATKVDLYVWASSHNKAYEKSLVLMEHGEVAKRADTLNTILVEADVRTFNNWINPLQLGTAPQENDMVAPILAMKGKTFAVLIADRPDALVPFMFHIPRTAADTIYFVIMSAWRNVMMFSQIEAYRKELADDGGKKMNAFAVFGGAHVNPEHKAKKALKDILIETSNDHFVYPYVYTEPGKYSFDWSWLKEDLFNLETNAIPLIPPSAPIVMDEPKNYYYWDKPMTYKPIAYKPIAYNGWDMISYIYIGVLIIFFICVSLSCLFGIFGVFIGYMVGEVVKKKSMDKKFMRFDREDAQSVV